jgi:hypothetical protein
MRGERRGFLLDRGLLGRGRCGGRGPSTASVIWLWNESRRISPSVTMSSPAAS